MSTLRANVTSPLSAPMACYSVVATTAKASDGTALANWPNLVGPQSPAADQNIKVIV